jgi:hypothetical protein
MPKIYGTAENVETIAKTLIPMYHPELASARMTWVFVDVGSKKNGKPVYGKVRKVSGILEYLLASDFIFEIAMDSWNELTEHQRHALLDHLLERCTGEESEKDGSMSWKMREPDVQEFAAVLRRQGAWHEDLNTFASVAKQINIEEIANEVSEEVTQGES